LNCSCDRGKLATDAPCVHNLVLASLGASGTKQRGLPTARELGAGEGLVEQVEADSSGRFFAVRSRPRGVSPAHKMLHRSVDGLWYCQGKRDGCPVQHDCSYILAAKLAIKAGQVHFAPGLLLGQNALSRAARQWLERWEGALPLLGRSGRSSELHASCEGAGEEEVHLMGLISGQRSEPAGCTGTDCFCQEHQQLFGVAEPSTLQNQGRTSVSHRRGRGGASSGGRVRRRGLLRLRHPREFRSRPRRRWARTQSDAGSPPAAAARWRVPNGDASMRAREGRRSCFRRRKRSR
jgi:hypothetical protein